MKYTIPIVISFCVALASCHTPHFIEKVEILEPESAYSLCNAEQAEFSLIVDFDIKGVATRSETYHFPRIVKEYEPFPTSMFCCSADGGRGGYVLSYGIRKANSTGITYRVSCSYTVDGKRKKIEKNLSTLWLEPKQENTDGISLDLKWKKTQNK
ncbi:MAG: hypothetical protein PF692_02105 [Kiritimatiellae bacterium]|nr:hypothetical protein [Kiritimatiellia bacterium]